jgi:hypothetical protein
MPSSGMLHLVALVRSDVSEDRIASIIRVTIIGELETIFHRSLLLFLVTASFRDAIYNILLITLMLYKYGMVTLPRLPVVHLLQPDNNRRTRKHLPNDLHSRLLVQLSYL